MDKYLLDILKDVNTIIVPGLGALTITNKDTGEIMFMPFLKHDDGQLATYIAEKEGWDINDAKNHIAKYVRDIIVRLDQGDTYDMFRFGTFRKDGDDIEFTQWSAENGSPASAMTPRETEPVSMPETVSGEPTVETPAPERMAEEVMEPETPAEEPTPVAEVVPEPVEEPTAPKAENTVEKTVHAPEPEEERSTPVIPISQVPAEPAPVEKQANPAPVKEMNILQKEELASSEKKLKELKKAKEQKPPRKKKGLGFWMLIALLVLLAGGGTMFGIYYDEVKQHIPFLADEKADEKDDATESDAGQENVNDGEENTEEEQAADETGTEDEPETEQVQEEPEPEPTTEPVINSSGDKPFHLIAGAFSSEANANRLADKLRAEGYQPRVGVVGGMHMVSVKSYATRAEAQAGISEVSAAAPKAWVMEWR